MAGADAKASAASAVAVGAMEAAEGSVEYPLAPMVDELVEVGTAVAVTVLEAEVMEAAAQAVAALEAAASAEAAMAAMEARQCWLRLLKAAQSATVITCGFGAGWKRRLRRRETRRPLLRRPWSRRS